MGLNMMGADEAIAHLADFDTIIDARSEGEYALDRLPLAVNWPTLHDDERMTIGTLYKQVNPFEARKRGGAIAARNIAAHIEREVLDKPRDWKPLAYCWRGGKRSGALALILDQIGFRVTLLEGGYKAFRAAVVANIPRQVQRLEFQVVCGTTGSGKTRLLQALAAQGAQVLDLEALASHRSSVLGAVPGVQQPSQKHFETLIWTQLKGFHSNTPVYVESESKKVGNVALPSALVERMRASPCLQLTLPEDERVALLLEDYDSLAKDPALFCARLDLLKEFRGKETVHAWQSQVMQGKVAPVVRALLTEHYDPIYLQSIQRNFVQYPQAPALRPHDRSMASMEVLAKALLAGHHAV
jgi:tRNA 2-selenouridine synthase